MNNTTDLSKSFSKLISANYFNFKGCLIEKNNGNFKWNGQCFYTLEELDKAINLSLGQLKNSISK